MAQEFEGKLVIVTGAAGTLGQAVAKAFAEQGASLALFDLDLPRLQSLYADAPPRTICKAVNLADAQAVASAVSAVAALHPRIDVLCNLAGGFRMGPAVHETSADLWQEMMDMNAHSLLHMVQAVVPYMLSARAGKIVSVAAGAGLKAGGRMGAYSASKSIVLRLTESLSAELKGSGINVNCVVPSIIDTPVNRKDMPDAEFGQWVSPVDLASVIRFLCSETSRAVHGAALPVAGLL